MGNVLVKCPSCNGCIKVEKKSDEQPLRCPKCNFRSIITQFKDVKLKIVFCPFCKTSLNIDSAYQGSAVCPKCSYNGEINSYPTSIQEEKEEDGKTSMTTQFINNRLYKPGILILVEGQCTPNKIILKKGVNTIGRKGQTLASFIQLETADEYMSKKHINIDLIMKSDYTFEHRLSDAGSTNGTYHNDEKITSDDIIILMAGDIVKIGRTKFKFIIE